MKVKRHIAILLTFIIATVSPVMAFADTGEADSASPLAYTENSESENNWTSEDFTYTDFSETLNDIGNTENLEVSGKAISGFSESGEAKLANNKNVTLPSDDGEGNTIVGVADSAFDSKGIESIEISAEGNYIIGKNAFKGNAITSLELPEGVVACMANSFMSNKLTTVSLPKSIWWLETQSFARNQIKTVNLPSESDRGLELHGLVFAANFIESLNIPNNTAYINKNAFAWNTGSEDLPSDAPSNLASYTTGDTTYSPNGVVYLNTTNESLKNNSNIHTVDIEDSSSHSYVQKLVVTNDNPGTNPDDGEDGKDDDESDSIEWTEEDFTYGKAEKLLYGCDYTRQFTISGRVVTGFSESGLAKLSKSTDIVLPSKDADGNTLIGVGDSAFKGKGLTSVVFPTGMMVDYDDDVTYSVTKRGNYIIFDEAFANNNLTEVYLPSGVIAVLSNAFMGNEITTVTLPKTIWWIETMSFARNLITTVNFPQTTDFSLEMHGWAFACNYIKSVRLPDFTEVVNKDVFDWNPGMEELEDGTPSAYKSRIDTITGRTYENCGIVYMYTANSALFEKDRIHTTERETQSQHSYVQKLILDESNVGEWSVDDFTYDGTTVTGLSETGIAKRGNTTRLVLPDKNPDGKYVTAIADAEPVSGGLFSTETEKFESVDLPQKLVTIGDNAFRDSGLKDIQFPNTLESIGVSAFQSNELTAVVLPDSITLLGDGVFATNPSLERIILSKGLTEIPNAAFACSDATHYMTNLESIDIPEGIVTIGNRAFAGNNFHDITLPSTVKTVGDYAFSTKNYLKETCTVKLNEGLETLGKYAFRNKCIEVIQLPSSLTSMKDNTFLKAYSDGATPIVTDVYVPTLSQYEDSENFPGNEQYHKFYLLDSSTWESPDFTYEYDDENGTSVITGFSEQGELKLRLNKSVEIPYLDDRGNTIVKVSSGAFSKKGITDLTLSATITEIAGNAFSGNSIEEVQLPNGIEIVDGDAFSDNGCTVQMYLDKTVEAPEGVISNDHQTLVAGTIDEVPTNWDIEDFTYDEESGTITGWSDSGNVKRLKLKELIIPEKTPEGNDIVAIGESAFEIPSDEVVVTKFGIESPNGMRSVSIPSTVTTIGKKAFSPIVK